jgi:hypothetical protein
LFTAPLPAANVLGLPENADETGVQLTLARLLYEYSLARGKSERACCLAQQRCESLTRCAQAPLMLLCRWVISTFTVLAACQPMSQLLQHCTRKLLMLVMRRQRTTWDI